MPSESLSISLSVSGTLVATIPGAFSSIPLAPGHEADIIRSILVARASGPGHAKGIGTDAHPTAHYLEHVWTHGSPRHGCLFCFPATSHQAADQKPAPARRLSRTIIRRSDGVIIRRLPVGASSRHKLSGHSDLTADQLGL